MAFFKQHKPVPGDIFRKLNELKIQIFHEDIINITQENTFFRKEVKTANNSKAVLMSLEPGESIGEEVHKVDQLLFCVSGHAQGIMNGKKIQIKPNDLVMVPAGTLHNFINSGNQTLKLFTIDTPFEHAASTFNKDKEYIEYIENEEEYTTSFH